MVAVSIIVDVSNTSESLSLTLSMIARQTYNDYELLIVGDAAVTNIIAEFPSQSLSKVPLQVIENSENINRITAINNAITQAQGDLIAVIQEGNEWHSDFLEAMTTALQDCRHAIFACSHCQTLLQGKTDKQEVSVKPVQQNLVEAMLADNFIHTLSSVVFRASLFRRIGLFDQDFEQFCDREFYLRALAIGKPVIVPLCLVRTNSIDNPLTHNHPVAAQTIRLTSQQQKQFAQVAFTQQIMQKALVNQNHHDIQVKLRLKTKFRLRSLTPDIFQPEPTLVITPKPLKSVIANDNDHLVSLIITVYNRASYVAATINSVLAQTYTNFELIIWDDGSTDDSLKIIRDYAQQDQRIKIFSEPNRGAVIALVNAISQANSQYLGLIDSDDLLHPEAIAQTLEVLESNPDVGMVYTDHFVINADGEVKGLGKRCSIPYSQERLLIDFMTFHFRLMRRDVYDAIGGFDGSLSSAEDYDLCLRLSEVTEIKHLAAPLYYYRWHEHNLSTTQSLIQSKCSAIAINRALARRGLNRKFELEVKLKPEYRLRRSTKVANKVFGIGLSKTGTTSLNDALNLLGIPSIHLPRSLEQIQEFDGATDTPIALAYKKLDLLYPGSKFVLTIREPKSWLGSYQSHQKRIIEKFNGRVSQWIMDLDTQCYGQWKYDASLWLAAYDQHLQSVLEYFQGRESDLLILNICQGQGWPELCSFLNCTIPSSSFPHRNQAEKFSMASSFNLTLH